MSQSQQLTASCANKVDGSFTYLPAAGAVLPSGHHVLSCRFEPLAPHNFHSVELTREIYVHRAVPQLVWRDPPALGVT